jgi:hypothetical protein
VVWEQLRKLEISSLFSFSFSFSFSFFLRFILEPAYLSWGGVCCYYGSAIFKNVFKIIFYF